MKTIEERAKAFCVAEICPECSDHKTCDRKCLTKCVPTDDPYYLLVKFAKSEHIELTRWNDPKEALPERSRDVLIKLQYEEDAKPSYTVGYWNGQWFGDILGADAEIIGWREIPE